MSSRPRLTRIERFDIPVREASSLDVRWLDSGARVLCVGDSDAVVAAADVTPSGLDQWRTLDLTDLDGWQRSGLADGDSQFEAVAVDGGYCVALVREDPAVLLLADTRDRSLTHVIELRVPPGTSLGSTWDDPASRGEGAVLLRSGRVLVVKEKKPAALIEMGPVGSAALGLSRDSFLAPGEHFEHPEDDSAFEALAIWVLAGRAARDLRDVSDLDRASDGSLWLLSDKSAAVGRLSLVEALPASGGTLETLDGVWRLPKKATKAEGLAVLDDRLIVAMDTKKPRKNGIVLERPDV